MSLQPSQPLAMYCISVFPEDFPNCLCACFHTAVVKSNFKKLVRMDFSFLLSLLDQYVQDGASVCH